MTKVIKKITLHFLVVLFDWAFTRILNKIGYDDVQSSNLCNLKDCIICDALGGNHEE